MVSRGDTTVYHAGAFKTMRSDPLSDLLKKLPGVEMREGKLYANGKIVQRILVNGTPLFGDYMDRAQELLRADNVENVKVYDQHSAQSIINGDTLKPKERVIDVTTKKKVNIVRQAFLGASGGVYLDKNADGNYEELYGLRGQYDRHKVGDNLSAWLDYGEKTYALSLPSCRFNNNLNGRLSWDRSFRKKIPIHDEYLLFQRPEQEQFQHVRRLFPDRKLRFPPADDPVGQPGEEGLIEQPQHVLLQDKQTSQHPGDRPGHRHPRPVGQLVVQRADAQ